MSDIVERLRKLADRERPYGSLPDTLDEAANEIECLRAGRSEQVLELKNHIDQQYAEIVRFQSQIKRLKAALRRLTCNCSDKAYHSECEADCPYWNARAALQTPTPPEAHND